MKKIDSFDLPPLQYLALENLAARYRLGETAWMFDTKVRAAIEGLAQRGLVHYKEGQVERTLLVFLTDAGREAAMDPSYVAPVIAETQRKLDVLSALPFCPHHGDNDPLCHAALRHVARREIDFRNVAVVTETGEVD